MAVKRSVKSMFMVCGRKQRQGKLKLGLAHENENPTLSRLSSPSTCTNEFTLLHTYMLHTLASLDLLFCSSDRSHRLPEPAYLRTQPLLRSPHP